MNGNVMRIYILLYRAHTSWDKLKMLISLHLFMC